MPKQKSRVVLWNELVAQARVELDAAREIEERLRDQKQTVVDILEQLKEIAEEAGAPYDNMNEGAQASPYGQKCEAIQQLDLEASQDDELDELEAKVDEAEGAEIPLGFGRD